MPRTVKPKIKTRRARRTPVATYAPKGGSIISREYRSRYEHGNNGDEVARAIAAATRDERGTVDPDRLAEVAAANGIDLARWAHCNLGQQRMNLGNVLRGKARRGEEIVIGASKFGAGQ